MQQNHRSPITSHVLDTALGKPASGIPLQLYYQPFNGDEINQQQEHWQLLASGVTDGDGRCSSLLDANQQLIAGLYKMCFKLSDYYSSHGIEAYFYPYAEIVFRVITSKTNDHFHIPLLLSPFGYTTYRGS
jgi:5-hydroxyisourate hydrolase